LGKGEIEAFNGVDILDRLETCLLIDSFGGITLITLITYKRLHMTLIMCRRIMFNIL